MGLTLVAARTEGASYRAYGWTARVFHRPRHLATPWTGPTGGLVRLSRSDTGLSTETDRQLQVSYRYLTIGMSRQVTAILPESESPSDRDLSRQVTVDNFSYPLDLSTTRSAAAPAIGATAAK